MADQFIFAKKGVEHFLVDNTTGTIPKHGGGTQTNSGWATLFMHKDYAHTQNQTLTVDSAASLVADGTVTLATAASKVCTIGATGVSTTLSVYAATTFQSGSALTIPDGTLVGGAGNSLSLSGGELKLTAPTNVLLSPAAAVQGTLSVSGTTTLVGAVTVALTATFSGAATFTKATTLSGSAAQLDMTAANNPALCQEGYGVQFGNNVLDVIKVTSGVMTISSLVSISVSKPTTFTGLLTASTGITSTVAQNNFSYSGAPTLFSSDGVRIGGSAIISYASSAIDMSTDTVVNGTLDATIVNITSSGGLQFSDTSSAKLYMVSGVPTFADELSVVGDLEIGGVLVTGEASLSIGGAGEITITGETHFTYAGAADTISSVTGKTQQEISIYNDGSGSITIGSGLMQSGVALVLAVDTGVILFWTGTKFRSLSQ